MLDYQWHDFVGNIGVAAILFGYLALQLETLDPRSLAYSVVNGLGAAAILVSLRYEFNLSAFVIEAVWLGISLLGIVRWLVRRRGRPAT